MAGIGFHKLHSAGNDFVVVIDLNGEAVPPGRENVLVRQICRPHFGIGADGFMLVQSQSVRHFDPDGTLSFCINGSLCLAALLPGFPEIPRKYSLNHVPVQIHYEGGVSTLSFRPELIQVQEITVDGYPGRYVFVGNPHFFIHGYPKDLSRARKQATEIRHNSIFPNGTNVSFWEHSGNSVRILTFERGVEDFTLCCGSACTAFTAGMHRSGETVFLPPSGGELIVTMNNETGTMTVKGAATYVCKGTYHLS